MGLFGAFVQAVSSAINIGEAREVVREAFQEALAVMEGMCGNAGQVTVFNDYVVPGFAENLGPVRDGWQDVDIGEYMEFMGEIVEEGNAIMSAAYEEANAILDELEEALEEGYGEFEEF